MQVFVSHAAADNALAKRISSALEHAGFSVWNWDSILPGDDFYSAASKALESSELMVVLFSPEASASEWVTRDVQYALIAGNYRGRVVPVLIDFVATPARKEVPWVLLRMIRSISITVRVRNRVFPRSSRAYPKSRAKGQMLPREVFLSHSSQDRAMAERIASACGLMGFRHSIRHSISSGRSSGKRKSSMRPKLRMVFGIALARRS